MGSNRSEHSIKNRFNTLVAKHRKYKTENHLNVAARILANLKRKIEGHRCSFEDKQELDEAGLIVAPVGSDQKVVS